MTTPASELYFLEELKGIEPGKEKVEVGKDGKTIEKLFDTYKKFESEIFEAESIDEDRLIAYLTEKGIDYSESDIADLVYWAGMHELDESRSMELGIYIGSLISILTEKNEKEGKRTIIDIRENKLDQLGWECRKFDVVRIGVNHGHGVFRYSKGKLLYVERCEGDMFAGSTKVDKIVAGEVYGGWFANYTQVNEIVAGKVQGQEFASNAKVKEIVAGKVMGNGFLSFASGTTVEKIVVSETADKCHFSESTKVKEIVGDPDEAKQEYEKAMKEIVDLRGFRWLPANYTS
jgi:molybdopterin-binding protein